MILLVLLASILIAAVTIYQYKEQTDEYNQGRLERKEEAVKALEVSCAEKEAAYTELQQSVEAKDKDFKERMEELKKMKKEKLKHWKMKS